MNTKLTQQAKRQLIGELFNDDSKSFMVDNPYSGYTQTLLIIVSSRFDATIKLIAFAAIHNAECVS